MSIVLGRVMVLVVEGGIARRPVHHARRLSVHHIAHRRVRTVRPARTCGQWWKHYTLLWLDLCSVIGRLLLDKLGNSPWIMVPLFFFRTNSGHRGVAELCPRSTMSPYSYEMKIKMSNWNELRHRSTSSLCCMYLCVCVRVYVCIYVCMDSCMYVCLRASYVYE